MRYSPGLEPLEQNMGIRKPQSWPRREHKKMPRPEMGEHWLQRIVRVSPPPLSLLKLHNGAGEHQRPKPSPSSSLCLLNAPCSCWSELLVLTKPRSLWALPIVPKAQMASNQWLVNDIGPREGGKLVGQHRPQRSLLFIQVTAQILVEFVKTTPLLPT